MDAYIVAWLDHVGAFWLSAVERIPVLVWTWWVLQSICYNSLGLSFLNSVMALLIVILPISNEAVKEDWGSSYKVTLSGKLIMNGK
jgi:hypothetical protein